MNKQLLALILVAASGRAMAQAPGKEQPLDAFLAQRVAEELATDGLLLSRLGVTLDIAIVGDTVLVSLIDSTTSRAVASTKIDRVTGDREAAVAQVTQVASSLAEQIAHPVATVPTEPPVTPPTTAESPQEQQFRERRIVFGESGDSWWGERSNHQAPYRGDIHRMLSEPEFFTAVARPDLASRYRFRLIGGWVAIVGGVGGLISGIVFSHWQENFHSSEPDWAIPAAGLGIVGGTISFIAGCYYVTHPSPLSTSETFDLATQYNQRLRTSLSLAPYATANGGGVMIGRSL